MSAICEGGLGASGPHIPKTASQYVTADKPETTAAFPVSQEIVMESNQNLTTNPNPPPHILVKFNKCAWALPRDLCIK